VHCSGDAGESPGDAGDAGGDGADLATGAEHARYLAEVAAIPPPAVGPGGWMMLLATS
jgi:hypothetical protein